MPVHIPPIRPLTLALFGGGAAVAAFAVIGIRAWKQARTKPEQRERQRRADLAARGKVSDATLIEIRDDALFYSYKVRGVEYAASQDISTLKDSIPADVVLGMGPVYVKYNAANPANSIVLSEQWCGLHAGRGRQTQARA